MNKAQRGLTLIELMVVVAIIGILALLAIPAYQSYTIRAQIVEGLNLAGPLKTAIVAFHGDNGTFPSDNAEAALHAAGNYSGKYVDSISVNGAVISIQYGNDANVQISGQTVTLTATSNEGSMSWTCASGGFISDVYLPTACR